MTCGSMKVAFSPVEPHTVGQMELSKRCCTGLCLILPQLWIELPLVSVQMVPFLKPSGKTLKQINFSFHFIFLACFGENFLWGKLKPAHSHLPPIFLSGCLTKNIPVLTPAHKPASVSAKGSASPASGTAAAAASDPNLN